MMRVNSRVRVKHWFMNARFYAAACLYLVTKLYYNLPWV